MSAFLNLAILKNPLNWVIVFLMLAITAAGFSIVGRYIENTQGKSS